MHSTLHLSLDLALEPTAAFDILFEELTAGLARAGLVFEPGPDGRVLEGDFEVGHVLEWKPGEGCVLRWQPANWQPAESTELALRLEPIAGGTRAVLEQRGWGKLTGSAEELAGWFAGEAAAPLLRATAPAAL